jgi:K+-sensing histidine kinase KdpD
MFKKTERMPKALRPAAIAVAAVLIATAANFVISPLLGGRVPMGVFLVAITVVATRWGLYPGLLTTCLSSGVVHFLFADTLSVVLQEYSLLAVLAVVGVIASLLGSRVHSTTRELLQTKADLEVVNRRLLQHAEWLAEANERLAKETRD